MKRVHAIWADNVVAERLLSNKLTYLSGIYEDNHLCGANMYEQELGITPDGKDKPPVLVKELDISETPITFSQGGGIRWHLKEERELIGLKLKCEHGNNGRLKKVIEVRYKSVFNYMNQEFTRSGLMQTGKEYSFKSCPVLEQDCYIDGKMVECCPVYMLPEDKLSLVAEKGKSPFCVRPDGTQVKPRFLGCNVFERGRFCRFSPAERLPSYLSEHFKP